MIASHPSFPPHSNVSDGNLAYCIHTSGSTGTSKGVLVGHREVVRLLLNDRMPLMFSQDDVWTMFHTSCSSFSVWEMYKSTSLWRQARHRTKSRTPRTRKNSSNCYWRKMSPFSTKRRSAFANTVDYSCPQGNASPGLALRYIIFGGEALDPRQLQSWPARYPGREAGQHVRDYRDHGACNSPAALGVKTFRET